MNLNLFQPIIFVLLGLITTAAASLNAQSATPPLLIEGEVSTPMSLSPEELRALPATTIKVKNRKGKKQRYRGVSLHELLKSAGVTQGEQLRGENLAKYILVRAADGYEVLFSLAETDPAFTSKKILLAYEVDEAPLPEGMGPYRLIVPDEARQARWIREVRSIRVEFHK
jgi:DMSO/TMAO reductase YedYZ molybdopterin-dependent catalytic subunit